MFRFFFPDQDEDADLDSLVREGSVIVHKEAVPALEQERKILQEKLTHSTGTKPRTQTGLPGSMSNHLRERELNGNIHYNQNAWISHSIIPDVPRVVVSRATQFFSGIYSPDGSEFVAAGQDHCVRIFDSKTWKLVHRIPVIEFGWSILDVDYTGTQLAYCTWSTNICLYTQGREDQERLSLGFDDRFGIFSLKFSPDERFILAGGSDERIHVYDLDHATVKHKVNAHSAHVNAVTWLGNSGNLMLSGSDDGMIKLWDTRDLRGDVPASIFVGHLDGISCIDCMENGDYFLSNSKDQSIKIWDARLGTAPTNAIPPPETYWDYRYGEEAFRRNERELRSGKYTHRNDHSVNTYRGHSVFRTLIRARFSPASTTGERYIYTGSAKNPFSVYIYDIASGKIVRQLKRGHSGIIRDVYWNPNFPQIVSTSWDGNIIQWDV